MKLSNIAKIFFAATLCFACIGGVTGCAQEETQDDNEALKTDTGLTGGVAATVNGTEIEEDKVTRYVNNIRIRGGYEDDDSWKEYLTKYNYTVESLRDEILDTLIDQELIIQCADQLGVTTDDAEIQSYVDKMRANYSSDEAWQTGLEGAGFSDEDQYREALHYSILNKKVEELFEGQASADDSAVLEQAQNSITSYDGAKRSSHILFAKEDADTAATVLQQLQSGALDFAEAAKEYSTDTGSAEKGGDVGFDKLTTFVEEYQTALDGLAVDQISGLVESDYGYHIIKCTEIFNAPETLTSLDQIPSDILAEIKTNVTDTSSDTMKDEWLDKVREENDVVVYPMPDNLPYWVDLGDDYTKEEEEAIDDAAEEKLADDVAATELETTDAEAAAADAEAAAE